MWCWPSPRSSTYPWRAAAALLERTPHPTDLEIDNAMTNICRCGTYGQIRNAIQRAARLPTKG
jgi:aerobic-type carbon monoxide dehydrogenase small subunit (CoxS/CutS family)